MAWKLQLILLTFSILFLFIIIKFIKKSKLTTDIAIIWILWGIGLIIISAFPILMQYIANILGIATTINALFLIMIYLLYCLVFYLFIKISALEDKVKNLTQYIALKEKNTRTD
ncbi:DUF2304 domain-containing protein [Holdemania sp. 1001095H_141210_F2]|uniref:DUF2304 domain-containing protein n=1 Tax=Holdemania sp. 1001095H_141210_F2 TaxID=2787149 RepID=UPI00189C667C|nr:DUF2304 domain-containing protein [Holdemania sp. 1001095H_141210_F2]